MHGGGKGGSATMKWRVDLRQKFHSKLIAHSLPMVYGMDGFHYGFDAVVPCTLK
jgi:hypothetical protein